MKPGARARNPTLVYIVGFDAEPVKVNGRELDNLIERALILERTDRITPKILPRSIRTLQIDTIDPERILPVDTFVKEYAEKVVKLLDGNHSKAAEVLGISRTSLWKILKEE